MKETLRETLHETHIKEIPELKIHGRTTSCREPLTLFWTASGFECNVSGTELWVLVEVTYDTFELWFSYTINGDWIGRQMLTRRQHYLGGGAVWGKTGRGLDTDALFRPEKLQLSDRPKAGCRIPCIFPERVGDTQRMG